MSAVNTRTAWWWNCDAEDECGVCMVVYPHPDQQVDLPDEDDWEQYPNWAACPVCGGSMTWGGTDHPADLIRNYPKED